MKYSSLYTLHSTLIIAIMLTIATTVHAVKADPTPTTIRQSDGTTLTVIGHGDSHHHWYTTTDGVLLYHQGFDYFVASIQPDGRLLPTGQLAHEKHLRGTEEKQLIKMATAHSSLFTLHSSLIQAQSRHQITNHPKRPKSLYDDDPTLFPHTGQPRVLVILAEFQDSTFKDQDPKSVFHQYLNADIIDNNVGNNSVGRNYGSVRKYFIDMSGGTFQPQFDIYGPVKLSHPLAYYGEGENDNMSRFVPEVCQLGYETGIDYSQYDSNDDGNVDLLFIIYAGYSESITGNSSDCIWPKSGTIYGVTYNGKNIRQYAVSAELNGYPDAWPGQYRINGVGVFCHEFSHTMGLPDFYPTTLKAQNQCNPAMEFWDLMDGGEYVYNGYYPTAYTAWEREAFGWATIDTLTTTTDYELCTMNYELINMDQPGGKAYRILNENDSTGNEYLILQNIQKKGWNKHQLGHGMLIVHVDYDPKAFSLLYNSVNNTIGHSRYTIIPADGELISSFAVDGKKITAQQYRDSHAGDTYPGTANVTEVEDIPLYNPPFNKRITDIQETEDGIITFCLEDIDTSIHSISAVPPHLRTSDTVFSLDGRPITSLKGAIYIRNHRKILNK